MPSSIAGPKPILASGRSRRTAVASTCAAECRNTPSASGSRSVRTRNAPPFRSGVMRSWISPSTDTATAAPSRRSPMDRTTSAGRVPAGTLRVAPSGSTRVSSSMSRAAGRSIMYDVGVERSGRSADQRREQARVLEVQHHAGNDRETDDDPQNDLPVRDGWFGLGDLGLRPNLARGTHLQAVFWGRRAAFFLHRFAKLSFVSYPCG